MSDAIQLSEQETKEIEKMMKENKSSSNQSEKKSEKEVNEEIQKSFKQMKRLLKVRTKSELIEIIWTYGIQLQEMQRVAQMLFEENKELKGE